MKYIYGPVRSRRLGFSLGVDLVPHKTCSFDCIYCQLGRTTNKTIERREYFKKEEVLEEIRLSVIGKNRKEIYYITFSGSGEPTLNSGIGWLINEISNIKNQKSKIPIAVLTNGSLLWDEQVREELLSADLVVPSLDAATEDVFKNINRPHLSLPIDKIVEGLKEFRKEFKGSIWLEIMLVKGVNDTPAELKSLKEKIAQISPDKVQLNTVVRPPAEEFACPLSFEELEEISRFFGSNCEVIVEKSWGRAKGVGRKRDIEASIIELVKRRPVREADISNSLGIHRIELIKYLSAMEKTGKIKRINYAGVIYYSIF